jgi:hypothetical protein
MRLSGSKVQIRLRISLDPLDPGPTGARPTHKSTRPGSTSSEDRCVPSVVTDGQSYRLAQATAGKGVIPCRTNRCGELRPSMARNRGHHREDLLTASAEIVMTVDKVATARASPRLSR